MRLPTLDLDVLRTFVLGIDLRSFAKAADRLGRSTSAISAHLKKLEEQVGTPVLNKSGRGLALTPVGEALLGHARRLLELNDSIFDALNQTRTEGTLCLGVQEDFGEWVLSDVLRRFALLYPMISLEVRIARNAELLTLVDSGNLDLALTWATGHASPYVTPLGQTPMHWIGPHDQPIPSRKVPLPLVMFDAPCVLRSAATEALDRAGIAWRVALTSPSVGGIWAAVDAGLGVTLRTSMGLPGHLRVLEELPSVPSLAYELHRNRQQPTEPVAQLATLIRESLERHLL